MFLNTRTAPLSTVSMTAAMLTGALVVVGVVVPQAMPGTR